MGEVNKDLILDFLRENKDYLRDKYGVEQIALFGSYARGEEKEDSDVDLLVKVRKKSFDNRFDIKEFLEKNLNRKVDLGYFDSVRPFIMRVIEEELIYA